MRGGERKAEKERRKRKELQQDKRKQKKQNLTKFLELHSSSVSEIFHMEI